MPGNLSNKDLDFLRAASLGLEKTTEANWLTLEFFEMQHKRNIEVASMAEKYIAEQGTLDWKFDKQLEEYVNNNPLYAAWEVRRYKDGRKFLVNRASKKIVNLND